MKETVTDDAKVEDHHDVAVQKRHHRITLIFSTSPRNVDSSPSMRTR
jgi:hypothetical protein